MREQFGHERLEVYRLYLDFARLCGKIVSGAGVSIAATDHLERATESIGMNLVRANDKSFGSGVRDHYIDISIGSAHESAACLDACVARKVLSEQKHHEGIKKVWRIRGMLLGLKGTSGERAQERQPQYGSGRFPHSKLDVYVVALDTVQWVHPLLEKTALNSRQKGKMDRSTTGTLLNIAEGYGRATAADRCRFFRSASEHAFQTVVQLDLMVAREYVSPKRIETGKALQHRVVSMLHSWCEKLDKESRG